ncbi:uncharacterized protein LOC114786645 isoform X2 [Denticeps clupeoides]|uniref:uncharacterized protein LOC114786645 isoform X2 n=1 Tax=Denticeps clupeoides TaxID=299321 RepID=UPI0010A4BFB9|nr:uncharacterized protein LOC114786645 isoform X2 [Denticeps clupeoides]
MEQKKVRVEQEVIIILSDSELEESVLLVEEEKAAVSSVPDGTPGEVLDDDLAIMVCQRGLVLPHARFDCGSHMFRATDYEANVPLETNGSFCDQCFCYVCDKPVTECSLWTVSGSCHCNAHKRSLDWKSLRDKGIMGFLRDLQFNFDSLEMDAELRKAERSLHRFSLTLAERYSSYLNNTTPLQPSCPCLCHPANYRVASQPPANESSGGCSGCQQQHVVLYDYRPVFECVSGFLDEAQKENLKAEAVMMLGAAKLFVTHTAATAGGAVNEPRGRVFDAVRMLLWRVACRFRDVCVCSSLLPSIIKTLQEFFHRLPVPAYCMTLRDSCKILPWDDHLLAAVLRGQNVSGQRHVKGRKQILFEANAVIQARVCKLHEEHKYREAARYLKAVRSSPSPFLQSVKDLVPFYLCKAGDIQAAITSMFSAGGSASSCSASRLTPHQLHSYIRIFILGHAPETESAPIRWQDVTPSGDTRFVEPVPVVLDALQARHWEPIGGVCKLKSIEVVKFTLRVLHCNTRAFLDRQTWQNLLMFVNTRPLPHGDTVTLVAFAEPDPTFLESARDVTLRALMDLQTGGQLQVPKSFLTLFPQQALLLLVTEAFAQRIVHSHFFPVLDAFLNYRRNWWALQWMFVRLEESPDGLQSLFSSILEELENEQSSASVLRRCAAESGFIGHLLSLFFLSDALQLRPFCYPGNRLLASWDESLYDWQYHLHQALEQNVVRLTSDKFKILQVMRRH